MGIHFTNLFIHNFFVRLYTMAKHYGHNTLYNTNTCRAIRLGQR